MEDIISTTYRLENYVNTFDINCYNVIYPYYSDYEIKISNKLLCNRCYNKRKQKLEVDNILEY